MLSTELRQKFNTGGGGGRRLSGDEWGRVKHRQRLKAAEKIWGLVSRNFGLRYNSVIRCYQGGCSGHLWAFKNADWMCQFLVF